MVGSNAHRPQSQSTGAHDEDLADTVLAALSEDVLHVLVGVEHGVHGQQGASRQHRGHGEGHRVGDLDQVLELVHDDELGVAVRHAIVRVQHHTVALLDGGVVLHLGAQGLDDAGHLVAGEEGAVTDAVVGGALGHAHAGQAADDGAAQAQVLRQLRAQAGHGPGAGH